MERGEVMAGSVPPARENMGTDSREAGGEIDGAVAEQMAQKGILQRGQCE